MPQGDSVPAGSHQGAAKRPPRPASSTRQVSPRLEVAWEPPSQTFLTSLHEILHGPRVRGGLGTAAHYFRDSWVHAKFPTRALAASVAVHIALAIFPFPPWWGSTPRPPLEAPRIEVTWYAPPLSLPPIAPRGPAAKPRPAGKPEQPPPRRGADAFHPRQTILSTPIRPTHPRQTLIQPAAPPTPPAILPPLPNIVQWAEASRPAKPRLQISRQALARLRPRRPRRNLPEVSVPAIPNQERTLGEMSIASTPVVNSRPRMPLAPTAVPTLGDRTSVVAPAEPAPEIGPSIPAANETDLGLRSLIALSASPAMPAPEISIPPGNLAARLSISPEGTQPGVPGGTPDGAASGAASTGNGPGATSGTGGSQPGTGGGSGGAGPPSVSITGTDPSGTSPVAGPAGTGPAKPLLLRPLPAKPEPRLGPAQPGRPRDFNAADTSGARPAPGFDRLKPGSPPEDLLGPKRVYTLHVNMPNLSSATGSWILRFAELQENGAGGIDPQNPLPAGRNPIDLVGPVPLRKVDPRYPPALASAQVQGEVVLYAIIRRDGSVDSIQLVRGVDPQLDHNAMEALSRWKFRPAERHGTPVELEAVVRIPFRIR